MLCWEKIPTSCSTFNINCIRMNVSWMLCTLHFVRTLYNVYPPFFNNKDILVCIYIFIYVLNRGHRFWPEFSCLRKSAILSCSMESAVSLADCFSTGYWAHRSRLRTNHRLNMVLDLQSLFGLPLYSCTPWLRPRTPRLPLIWAHIRGRYWSAKIDDISL